MALPYPLWIFLAATIIASYTDLRWRRVPNLLTYGVFAAIVALTASAHGILACFTAAGSAIVVLLAGSLIFSYGWLGGGDIKLLAAGAAAIGFPGFFLVFFYVAVTGGIIGALYALHASRLRTIATHIVLSAVAGTNVTPAASSRRVPYVLAICAGAFLYAASESFAPWLQFVH